MVVMKLDVKESSENLNRRQDLPTPESSNPLRSMCQLGVHGQQRAKRRGLTAIPNQEKLY